jgi:hypothetical protein
MTNSKNCALDRLARAYPDAFKAEASRTKPFYDVSSKTSVLNHFHNATDSVMGKAIMLANRQSVVMQPNFSKKLSRIWPAPDRIEENL